MKAHCTANCNYNDYETLTTELLLHSAKLHRRAIRREAHFIQVSWGWGKKNLQRMMKAPDDGLTNTGHKFGHFRVIPMSCFRVMAGERERMMLWKVYRRDQCNSLNEVRHFVHRNSTLKRVLNGSCTMGECLAISNQKTSSIDYHVPESKCCELGPKSRRASCSCCMRSSTEAMSALRRLLRSSRRLTFLCESTTRISWNWLAMSLS